MTLSHLTHIIFNSISISPKFGLSRQRFISYLNTQQKNDFKSG